MEQEQGAQDRYQIPWLLMLGNETQGTQLCTQWRLQPTDKPAWFGRWWSDPEGAVLVVPQALFFCRMKACTCNAAVGGACWD